MAEKGKTAPAPPGPPRKGDSKTGATGNARVDAMQKRAQALAAGSAGPKVGAKQFLEEAWVELKKTTWPNRTVLIKSTTVVLALVVAVAVWDGLIDTILTHSLDRLFGALR